jgi:ATP-binding cassette subfamily C protein CydD
LPQRPVMVPGTVRANLELFGQLPDIETACRATGFDEVLATLLDGLDTVIGRDGTGLSLGQRQRLALPWRSQQCPRGSSPGRGRCHRCSI